MRRAVYHIKLFNRVHSFTLFSFVFSLFFLAYIIYHFQLFFCLFMQQSCSCGAGIRLSVSVCSSHFFFKPPRRLNTNLTATYLSIIFIPQAIFSVFKIFISLGFTTMPLSSFLFSLTWDNIVVFQPPFLLVLTLSHLVLVVRNLYNQTRPARQSPVEVSRPRNRRVLNV